MLLPPMNGHKVNMPYDDEDTLQDCEDEDGDPRLMQVSDLEVCKISAEIYQKYLAILAEILHT